MKALSVTALLTLFLFPQFIWAQNYPELPNLKEEAAWIDQVILWRMESVLPEIMKRENVDMWIVMAREYNEDPVIRTMLPATWFAARRRTILVFIRSGDKVERFAIARYDIGKLFKKNWNPEKQPNQLKRLADMVLIHNPEKIALNYSNTFAQADGITYSEYQAFMKELRPEFHKSVVSGERLAVAWLETRIPEEIEMMQKLTATGHELIRRGFSSEVIKPGETSTEDVVWWFREEIRRLGLQTWFHPTVDVQRIQAPIKDDDFSSKDPSSMIQYGDLLHVDIGITYARLNTDQQQHAYVLWPQETDAPQDLKDALKVGNRLQDHLTQAFKTGRSGNEVLRIARENAIKDGIKPSIYTHPLGFYGHAAGPTIGLWDNQGIVNGSGEYPVQPRTGYSIELNATVPIPSWNKEIKIMLEENAWFDGEMVHYYNGRQTDLILIR